MDSEIFDTLQSLPEISSTRNPGFQAALSLRKGRERRDSGLFGVEGAREIEHAMAGGFEPVEAMICPEMLSDEAEALLDALMATESRMVRVPPNLYTKLALRETSDGLWVSFKIRTTALCELDLKAQPLLIAMEKVEKPGNLGALARTAEAAGADALIALDPIADPFNPNAIRASLGSLFRLPVVISRPPEFLSFCVENGIRLISTSPDASRPYYEVNYLTGSAIIVGSEADGLSPILTRGESVDVVRIPMSGTMDSLNVSVAGAILLFEARRQRETNPLKDSGEPPC